MRRLLIAATILLSLAPASGVTAASPLNSSFVSTWDRTDLPVADGQVSRSWMWGDLVASQAPEAYQSAPGGQRLVVYFDKARMEINNPAADQSSAWYVTNGLLATELLTGELQVGDNVFQAHEPAAINLAGDPNDPNGPTYADFGRTMADPPVALGTVLTAVIDHAGTVSQDNGFAHYGVTAAVLSSDTNHTVASVFWQFMNSSGPIADGNQVENGSLFPNPFYATGFPVTEAYWTRVMVGGVVRDVLVQCFQRRCLTYTPSNPDGWQVEAGNVGLHYYYWRYHDLADSATSSNSQSGTSTTTTTTSGDSQTVTSTQTQTTSSSDGSQQSSQSNSVEIVQTQPGNNTTQYNQQNSNQQYTSGMGQLP